MKFSLVSAPVLGFDLVRHPHGDAVAEVLLRALTAGPDDLEVFLAAHARLDEERRAAAWAQIRAQSERTWSNRRTSHPAFVADETATAEADLSEIVIDLRERMIVDLDDITHLVGSDVLAWCAEEPARAGAPRDVAGPFVDAIAAVWQADLDGALQRALAAPFLQAARTVPARDPDVGPQRDDVQAIVARLGNLTAADRERLRATVARDRPSAHDWSQAMHEASWAAFTTGRTRPAAAAQLLTVRAFGASGLDAVDGAEGVWNAVSGHVHATVVADVLADGVRDVLARTWRRALESASC